MMWGERAAMEERLQAAGLTGWIQTAFVERLNLTLRHLVSALVRPTCALANNAHSCAGAGGDRACVEHPGVQYPSGVLGA